MNRWDKEQRKIYMREWRKNNRDRCQEYRDRHRAQGDGWEDDITAFIPESPLQSRLWRQLLEAARG